MLVYQILLGILAAVVLLFFPLASQCIAGIFLLPFLFVAYILNEVWNFIEVQLGTKPENQNGVEGDSPPSFSD